MENNFQSIPAEKLKDALITRTAIILLTPENIVEKVVMFQGEDASKAVHYCDQIEFAGLGVFRISKRKIELKIKTLEKVAEKMRVKINSGDYTEGKLKKLNDTEKTLQHLKNRIMKIDLKGIMEGIKNKVFPRKEIKELIENTYTERIAICRACPRNSENDLAHKDTLRFDEYCLECGCNLGLKGRCLSCSCPLERWGAVVTPEQDEQIKSTLNEQSN